MERRSRRRSPGLTGTQLKVIAMVSMAVDHAAYVLVYPAVLTGFAPAWIYLAMRAFGRLAFPIYGFLLAQGFLNTSDRRRYLGRLCLFALISEVPFDLAVAGRVFYPGAQNVFVTLAVALGTLWGLERAEDGELAGGPGGGEPSAARPGHLLKAAAILAAGGLAAQFLRSDYGFLGVAFAAEVYLFRMDPAKRLMGEIVSLGLLGFWNLPCLLAIPLTEKYNGERGKRLGLWAYWFYPVHLLALKGLQMMI